MAIKDSMTGTAITTAVPDGVALLAECNAVLKQADHIGKPFWQGVAAAASGKRAILLTFSTSAKEDSSSAVRIWASKASLVTLSAAALNSAAISALL